MGMPALRRHADRSRHAWAALLGALLALAACRDAVTESARCTVRDDCPRDQSCVDGTCMRLDRPVILDSGVLDARSPRDAAPRDAGVDDARALADADPPEAAGVDADVRDGDATPGDTTSGGLPDAAQPLDATSGGLPDAAQPLDATSGGLVDAGPVAIGAYDYRRVILPGLASTRELGALAITPSGDHLIVAEREDRLRLVALPSETSTRTVALPKDASEPIVIDALAHVPSGALLIAATAMTGSSTPRTPQGRLYRAGPRLEGLVELRAARASGSSYRAITTSRRSGETTVLAQRAAGAGYVMTLSRYDDTTRALTAPRVESTAAPIDDVAWADDGLGGEARVFVGGLAGAAIGHIDSTGARVDGSGAGNTSRVAARPQGDYALAVAWSSSRLLRFRAGAWAVQQAPFLGASTAWEVEPSDDGARFVIAGGFDRARDVLFVAEYRDPLYAEADIVDVSIPAFSQAPWQGVAGAGVFDVVWRPGCDGGYMAGGCNLPSCQRGYLIAFQVLNGRRCP
jgi:hypothetical protein